MLRKDSQALTAGAHKDAHRPFVFAGMILRRDAESAESAENAEKTRIKVFSAFFVSLR